MAHMPNGEKEKKIKKMKARKSMIVLCIKSSLLIFLLGLHQILTTMDGKIISIAWREVER